MLEKALVHHCAPTLMGIKAANLFAYPNQSERALFFEMGMLNARLQKKGILLLPLRKEEGWALIYLCRPRRLCAELKDPLAQRLLSRYGYRGASLSGLLPTLSDRLSQGAAFPHEIGLFLSYPPKDVECFIEREGRGYLCIGAWKVYESAERAKRTFLAYEAARRLCEKRFLEGVELENLAVSDEQLDKRDSIC